MTWEDWDILCANEPSGYFSFKGLFCTDWSVHLNWSIMFTKSSFSETVIYNKIWFLLHYSHLSQYVYLTYVKWSYIAWTCPRLYGMLEISESPFQIILIELRIVGLLFVFFQHTKPERHVSLVCLSLLYNLMVLLLKTHRFERNVLRVVLLEESLNNCSEKM